MDKKPLVYSHVTSVYERAKQLLTRRTEKQVTVSLSNTGPKPASKSNSHGSCEKEAHRSLLSLNGHNSPHSLKPWPVERSVICTTVRHDLKTKHTSKNHLKSANHVAYTTSKGKADIYTTFLRLLEHHAFKFLSD